MCQMVRHRIAGLVEKPDASEAPQTLCQLVDMY